MKPLLPLIGLLLAFPIPAFAEDEANGRELYLFSDGAESMACTACHDENYFRDPSNRTAASLAELRGWIQGCNQRFPQGWFPEEENAVADYLANEYYGFERR